VLKKIEICKEAFDQLSKDKKTFDTLQKALSFTPHTEYVFRDDYYREYPHGSSILDGPRVLRAVGKVFLIEYTGSELVVGKVNNEAEELFKIYEAAANYEKLKNSLDHIKGVLG
jgi:hypothetical protein